MSEREMSSVIPPPKCPKCGRELEIEYDWDTAEPSVACYQNDHSFRADGMEAINRLYFLAGLEAAREAIRPISDEEELSPVAEAQWERLRALIEVAKKEAGGG